MDDDLIIRVGNPIDSPNSPGRAAIYDLAGWTDIRVQRSCEYFPSVFAIEATERFPGDNVDVPVRPGDPCQVLFTRGQGRDVVVTGYVDQVTPGLSAGRHSMSIVGRSKCQDLVDCSAVWPTAQFNNVSVMTIATNLAAPFGITVSQTSGEQRIIPQLVFRWGETPYELIERVARFAALLVYDDADGNLVLSRVGTAKMASAIVEGKNVMRASVGFSMSERYSQYVVRRLTTAPFRDSGADPEADVVAKIPDLGVPRFRPTFIIAETPSGIGLDLAIARGEWEASRRFGRATQIRVTVDSWRDGDGNLWAPNSIVDIDLPTLKLGKAQQERPFVISTVTFRRSERGTEADLLIMPASAFDVFPVPLTPILNVGPFPGAQQ